MSLGLRSQAFRSVRLTRLQDCELLLQEHHLYRCSLVVHDLLRVEQSIVRRPCIPLEILLLTNLPASSSTPTCCSGTRSGRSCRSSLWVSSTVSLVCLVPQSPLVVAILIQTSQTTTSSWRCPSSTVIRCKGSTSTSSCSVSTCSMEPIRYVLHLT